MFFSVTEYGTILSDFHVKGFKFIGRKWLLLPSLENFESRFVVAEDRWGLGRVEGCLGRHRGAPEPLPLPLAVV